jgi:hypothetical protein
MAYDKNKKYDFVGWATRNNVRCTDGRRIIMDAFKDSCGTQVPLVWNHQHDGPADVLGHADLVNCPQGVKAYCSFNDTENGELSKVLVKHGDIVALSIYANHLKEKNGDVLHGDICEVSLVHKGANPGAFIENVLIHGDTTDGDAAIMCFYDPEYMAHSDEDVPEEEQKKEETTEKTLEHADKEEPKMAEEKKPAESGEKTLQDVFDTMNEEQKNVCYAMVGMALEDAKGKKSDDDDDEDEDEGGNGKMKHNAFDQTYERTESYLSHADQQAIIELAKNVQVGSLKNAMALYGEDNGTVLCHSTDAVGGFAQDTDPGNITWLFPEYKDLKPGAPELITNDQTWITGLMNKVQKLPFSRIRTRQVDIRNIEGAMDSLRGKGYQKGAQKRLSGNFRLARRTTDPQTVYVRNSLHRDDIVDITDFDYVQYLYNIDRMELNEELATAILFGDDREISDPDKIFPEHIRPIWTDDELYTMHYDVDIAGARAKIQGTNTTANFGDNYIYAEAVIIAMLYAREKFKGSGTPDMYCTPHLVNVMLLARDINGRRIYNSVSELASALNVGAIHTVEQMENRTRTDGEGASAKTKKLLALVGNMNDYAIGSTKGGEITHFTQFDIDFNQEKSLIETRLSGAITRVYSFIALEEDVTE